MGIHDFATVLAHMTAGRPNNFTNILDVNSAVSGEAVVQGTTDWMRTLPVSNCRLRVRSQRK
jgi:hypothetical protein